MSREDFLAHVSDDGRRCVVVDVETTGLSPRRGDRVIEVGAVAIEKKQIAEALKMSFDSYKKQGWV